MAKIIPISAIKHIQLELRKQGLYSGNIDGIRTVANKLSMTDEGINKALDKRQSELKLDPTESTYKSWSEKRKAIGYFQLLLKDANFQAGPADGYWGPQTEVAYQQFSGKLDRNWRDEMDKKPSAPSSPLLRNPNNWPRETQSELTAFFGEAGKPPLVRVEVPWRMMLAWNPPTIITHVSAHAKVAASLSRVFQRVANDYTAKEISEFGYDKFGGIFNDRDKRGGTTKSTHAWAIAMDIDPERNQLRWGRDRAFLARPENDLFWQAWEAEGWTSLGRKKNFDWMHAQATFG